MQLRKYQADLIDKIIERLNKGDKKICVQLGTGGGKTVIFSHIINRALQNEKVLLLFDSIELIKSFLKINNNKNISIFMIETFFNKIKRNEISLDKYTFIIVDECHTGNFIKLYKKITSQHILGFSATPMFANSKENISDYFENIVIGETNKNLIEEGYLCESIEIIPEERFLMSRNYKFSKVQDFSISDMEKEVNNYEYFEKVYSQININKITGLKLCYLVSINHCDNFYRFLKDKGEECYIVTSEHKDDRDDILEVRDGYIITCGSLKKGYDNAYIMAIIHLYATTSLTNYLQRVGRGSRPNALIGKKTFINLDFGSNVLYFGRFSKYRDWVNIFNERKFFTNEKILNRCLKCGELIEANKDFCICGEKIIKKIRVNKKTDFKDIMFDTSTINLDTLFKNSYNITEDKLRQVKQKVPYMIAFNLYFDSLMLELFFNIETNNSLISKKNKYKMILNFFINEIDFKRIESFFKNIKISLSDFLLSETCLKRYFVTYMWENHKLNNTKYKTLKRIEKAISRA